MKVLNISLTEVEVYWKEDGEIEFFEMEDFIKKHGCPHQMWLFQDNSNNKQLKASV